MGIRFKRERFANRQRNNQAEQQRSLPSLRLQTRPHLRVYLSGEESFGIGTRFRRRSRFCFFSALRNERPHWTTEPAGDGEENHRHPLCLRLGPLAKRKIPPRLCLPRIQRRRGAQKNLRCDCPSRGGRRKIVFELRICPARHFVAATHEPTRSRAFPFRLQCIERSADGKARRNSQTPQDRSVCTPHSNFHGILAKARLSRPHRRERQGRVHPGKSSNLRNRQRAAQPSLRLRTGERRHSTTRQPFARGGGSPGADRRHGSMGNAGDFSAAESISKSE